MRRLFYAVLLNDRRSLKRFKDTRWTVYEHTADGLQELGPRKSHPGDRGTLLPRMVLSMRDGLPPYHFMLPQPRPLFTLAREFAKLYAGDVEIVPLGAPTSLDDGGTISIFVPVRARPEEAAHA